MRWKVFHASRDQIEQLHGVSVSSDEGLIFFQNDKSHEAEESTANIKWMKKRHLLNLENANQVEFARSAFFNAGVHKKYVPSAHRVY